MEDEPFPLFAEESIRIHEKKIKEKEDEKNTKRD